MRPLNPIVAAALGGLLGSKEAADCFILFVREATPSPGSNGPEGDGGREAGALAEMLPAHTFVLRYASRWFAAKLANMRANQLHGSSSSSAGRGANKVPQQQTPPEAAASGDGRTGDSNSGGPHDSDEGPPAWPALPVLRVPLGGPEELPSALAAIRFAYTGEVAAGSCVREVLELYRQGEYLQVEGCGATCMAAIRGMLESEASSSGVGNGGGGAGSSSGSGSSSPGDRLNPAVLELYECTQLWPDPALETAFNSVLSAVKRLLVSHFGDTLATLNTPELRRQLLALPAEGLEALLQSDEFGTDVEDSILLLLATWVQRNGGAAGVEVVERLCRLVPQGPAFGWSISQEELERGLRGLCGSTELPTTLDSGLGTIVARGLEWRPVLVIHRLRPRPAIAFRTRLLCELPAAYGLDASTLGGPLVVVVTAPGSRLQVDRWRDGARVEEVYAEAYEGPCLLKSLQAAGQPGASLKHQPASGSKDAMGNQQAPGGAGSADLLHLGSEYLHGGKTTGRLILLP
ncbi:hypothetical protein GPECTOR_179g243 [Gonium pectorale]|uniref:BACK domain-containing protein n=1 Tax=Gonium pectorale TaxID=33097 RepID=A0A150FYU2_GONPE|nr:hypothetical protein GPECTOR_179g243 [Gonium pectorale]|eukprot:KXZ42220.1 hypothetical protein GPECTOR_179g243 [Gonium pectorale]